MTISIHFNTVDTKFNVYRDDGSINRNSKSEGGGILHHIERTDADVSNVMEHTNSIIHPETTAQNVAYIAPAESESRLKQARKLIRERMAKQKEINGGEDADKQRAELVKKRNSARRKMTRRAKKGQDVSQAEKEWKSLKKQISALDAQSKSNNTDVWSARTGIGSIATLQLDAKTLQTLGWRYHSRDKHPFTYQEQLKYQQSHPDNKDAIYGVKQVYGGVFNAIKEHPEHYGDVVSASLHFDEGAPHVDMLTFNTGQMLNGQWITKHIGDKDNATHDNRYNIRARTFLNGANYYPAEKTFADGHKEVVNSQNRAWASKLQDNLGDDVKDYLHHAISEPAVADGFIATLGLTRGKKESAKVKAMREELANTDDKLSATASMYDMASSIASQAIADSKASASARSSVLSSMTASFNSSAMRERAQMASQNREVYHHARNLGYNEGLNDADMQFADAIREANKLVSSGVDSTFKRLTIWANNYARSYKSSVDADVKSEAKTLISLRADNNSLRSENKRLSEVNYDDSRVSDLYSHSSSAPASDFDSFRQELLSEADRRNNSIASAFLSSSSESSSEHPEDSLITMSNELTSPDAVSDASSDDKSEESLASDYYTIDDDNHPDDDGPEF